MGLFDRFKKSNDGGTGTAHGFDTIPLIPWEKGYRIKNRWEILDIKKGGMGVVYIVHDHEWNRKFALKTFQDKYLGDEQAFRRFITEAETWTKLERHTNIVFADFVEIIEGRPVMFLEYIEGGDLSPFVRRLGIPDVLDFAIQFCTGMEYAYRKLGVIHRDIKPGNIMVRKDPRFRSGLCFMVTDFGLVRALDPLSSYNARNVTTGVGTFLFMPPEQYPKEVQDRYRYSGSISTRSDIFSFGVTLYVLLAGRLPFDDEARTFRESPTPLKKYNPLVPDTLDALILRCLEKDTALRPADFSELKSQLIAICNGIEPGSCVVVGKQEDLSDIDWLNRGVALNNLGKNEEAMACIGRALAINGSEPRAWNDKGSTLLHMKRIPEAMDCFGKALTLWPKYSGAIFRMGSAYAQAGDYPEAIRWYDRALEIDPDLTEVLGLKGVALASQGNHKDAIRYFERALSLYPRNPEILGYMGASLCALQNYDEAVPYFDRAVKINPRDTNVLSAKGMSLFGFKKYAEALAYFNRAIELDPKKPMPWYGKGASLAALGKYHEAIQCLETHIDLYPRNLAQLGIDPTVRQARGIIGDLQQMIAANTITITRNPNSLPSPKIESGLTDKSLETMYTQGVTFASRGQFNEALECYDNVLRNDPGNPRIWMMKGLALACLGRFPDVIECCDRALVLKPGFPEAWNNKGTALAYLGKKQEALECYDKVLGLNPRCAEAMFNRLLVWKNAPATLKPGSLYWSKMQQENKFLNGM